jgi:hypothetical protein
MRRLLRRLKAALIIDEPAPTGLVLDDTRETVALEHAARHREALRVIRRAMLEESLKDPGHRDAGRLDLALDLKSILAPAPADGEVLREVPLRTAVPARSVRAS